MGGVGMGEDHMGTDTDPGAPKLNEQLTDDSVYRVYQACKRHDR